MLYCDCRKFNWPLVFLFFRSWWLAEEYLFAVLYLLTTVYTRKTILGIFVYLFISRVTTIKVNFVFTNSAVNVQHILFATKPFLHKTLVYFLSSNIPFYIEKKLWKDYVRFWKWNLKHTPQSIQTLFSRRSNLMFCITFNIISLAQGSVKIRLSCSKVLLLINFFYCRLWNTFKNLFWWLYKSHQL